MALGKGVVNEKFKAETAKVILVFRRQGHEVQGVCHLFLFERFHDPLVQGKTGQGGFHFSQGFKKYRLLSPWSSTWRKLCRIASHTGLTWASKA